MSGSPATAHPATAALGSALPASTGASIARRLVGVVLIVFVAFVLATNLMRLSSDPTANFGSDWWWYLDGWQRLAAGVPLYDARFLTGPYMQLQNDLLFTWNQAPTLVLPVGLFVLLVPGPLQFLAWWVTMLLCIVASFALVWPRGLSVAGSLLLALVLAILPPPLWGFWWANASCVVALGTALVIAGDRRRSTALMTAGLVVAGAAKIVPAVPLAVWLLLRRRGVRPIIGAAAAGAALLVPVLLVYGPGVVGDFLTATRNAVQAGSGSNVAPNIFLSLVIGDQAALVVCWALAGVATVVALRRRADLVSLLLLIVASDLLITNLWIHWLLAPMVVIVAMLGPRTVRSLDMAVGSAPLGGPSGGVSADDGDAGRVPAGGA